MLFQWPVIERDCVGGLRLIIWDKVKVPQCHYSDAPEERDTSDLVDDKRLFSRKKAAFRVYI